jgi:hypothetical protein
VIWVLVTQMMKRLSASSMTKKKPLHEGLCSL